MYKHGGSHYTYPDCVDFSANLNPLGMPENVRIAAERGVYDAVYYPDTECALLRQAIVTELNKEFGKEEIQIKDSIIGNGAADLLFQVCRALRPRKALLAVPTFQEYEQALQSVECFCVYWNLLPEEDFQLNVTDFLEQLTEEYDILFLCNPNNPTGQLVTQSRMAEILKKCKEKNIFLVVDECFMDFCIAGRDNSLLPYCTTYKNLLVVKAFTKLYAMPGLRLGYGISTNQDLMQAMKEAVQPWNISTPAQYAGIAALQEKEYVKDTIAYIAMERTYLINEIRQNQLAEKIFPTEANYLLIKADEELGNELLKRGFVIRDCSNYRNLTSGYYRLAVRTREENVKLIEAWKKAACRHASKFERNNPLIGTRHKVADGR